jgi:hypothetical protein
MEDAVISPSRRRPKVDNLHGVERLAAGLVELGSLGLVVHHRRRGAPGQEHGGLGVDQQFHSLASI